jgi:hypothetical protein
VPKAELGALPGPKRTVKKRRPTSPKFTTPVSMEDDVPEVTEWTANGLPQRRSRVKTSLTQRYAEQAEIERAEREGRPTIWSTAGREPEPEPKPDDTPPGLWVQAFMDGLKRPTASAVTQPTDEPARTEAEDEGNLK